MEALALAVLAARYVRLFDKRWTSVDVDVRFVSGRWYLWDVRPS